MSESIKKIGIPTATIGAAIMMLAPMLLQGAFAAPTIHGGECTTVDDNLVCEFDVSGLGGATTATATLTGTATVTTGCVTPPGNNEPSGLQRSTVDVLETSTVNVEGGRATFTFATDFNAEDLRDCPSANMTPVIVCATFTNLQLEVDPNAGPTRTFNLPDESSC
jgi:hypothetical protein